MIDPNKHGTFNNDNKIKPNWGMIGVLLTGIGFWVNVWFNGLFNSIIWLIIITAIVILILRLKGEI
tara:strand:+ start:130 stop:327 length:198 start_codon:yes stop_codon:yes gene_type:complete